MAKKKSKQAWQMSIFVPDGSTLHGDDIVPGPNTELQSKGLLRTLFGGKEVEVSADSVRQQWSDTISGLMASVSEWSSSSAGPWRIEEVNVGMTLSVEGKLLFIAKAGASGTIEIKLKRTDMSNKK